MSNSGRDTNLIEDDLQANYRAVREEAGRTWVEQAEEFERQAEAAHGDRSLFRLAAWARSEAVLAGEIETPAEREGTTPQQPRRGGKRSPRRTTEAEPAPHRTNADGSTGSWAAPADAVAAPADIAQVDGPAAGVPVAV